MTRATGGLAGLLALIAFCVAALAADWGVDATEHGKQVWARIPVRRTA